MNRRRFLHSGAVGVSTALLAGCFGSGFSLSKRPVQSGSGHPCDNPRAIDYDAVDQYRDHGVYLENSDDAAHTACATVTKEHRDREEEEGTASPPPLSHMGYTIHPGMAVEIFTFDENGHYTIDVSIEETTKKEAFEKTQADFNDGTTTITTFEITSASTIQLTRSGDS